MDYLYGCFDIGRAIQSRFTVACISKSKEKGSVG
jgi:hypothetical protein